MLVLNKVSRYHVAIRAIQGAARHNLNVQVDAHLLITNLEHEIQKHREYILVNGKGIETLSTTVCLHE